MSYWKISGSKIQGSSHIRGNIPCQDAFRTYVSPDGQWASLAVSDGAGSATRAEEGSKIVAEHLAQKLLELSSQFSKRPPGAWVNDFVIEQVLAIREKLRQTAQSDSIADFHATVVAALVGPSGGFSIHIGDGAIMSGQLESSKQEDRADLIKVKSLSKPENGEYANETYFITEGDWIKHIRISPIGQVDWIILGTDGGCALTLKNEAHPNTDFIAEFFQKILPYSSEDGNQQIQSFLESELAQKLSTDDKTIVWCVKAEAAESFQAKVLEVFQDGTIVPVQEIKETSVNEPQSISVPPSSKDSSATTVAPKTLGSVELNIASLKNSTSDLLVNSSLNESQVTSSVKTNIDKTTVTQSIVDLPRYDSPPSKTKGDVNRFVIPLLIAVVFVLIAILGVVLFTATKGSSSDKVEVVKEVIKNKEPLIKKDELSIKENSVKQDENTAGSEEPVKKIKNKK